MGTGCADSTSTPSAFGDGERRLVAAVEAAVGAESDGMRRLSGGLGAALEFLAGDPALAKLLLIDSLRSERRARLEYEAALERLAGALREAQESISDAPTLSPENASLLAGGIVSHLGGRVLRGEAGRLPESHDLLLRFVVGRP
jgi:hypothetical protein